MGSEFESAISVVRDAEIKSPVLVDSTKKPKRVVKMTRAAFSW
jgi:hypothetical protein